MKVIYVKGNNKCDGTIACLCSACSANITDIDDGWRFCPYCGEKIDGHVNMTDMECDYKYKQCNKTECHYYYHKICIHRFECIFSNEFKWEVENEIKGTSDKRTGKR